VGLKTTRLRAPGGEEVVMSNADLLKNAVNNYKRQETRRVVVKLSLALHTPAAQAAWVPRMLREAIEGREGIQFDRAHLQRIGESALEYEVVFIVQRADYMFYMDQQQDILLQVMHKLDEAGIDFGMPRTLLEQSFEEDVPAAPGGEQARDGHHPAVRPSARQRRRIAQPGS
jgi:small-conductance mechanosensitive channel